MMISQKQDVTHKKRFGQYFSGKTVAEMLFSLLPQNREWRTVIDPMAGIGDMLVAVSELSKGTPKIVGIEIDDIVAKHCQDRNPKFEVHCEDAFKSKSLWSSEGWDLVITNPPYVRYQLLGDDESVMPSAQEIRTNLLQQIECAEHISHTEKELFRSLAKNYSGLADMAVPAWILCALLVKHNGYLAVVVPETWLNREYACPIQYLLTKCFHIEAISRDTKANWFSDATVKTCLVVAKRQKALPIANTRNRETKIIEANRTCTTKTLSLFPHMFAGSDTPKWICDEDIGEVSAKAELPHELLDLIDSYTNTSYLTLEDIGISCGQGLRTGANGFFYMSYIRDSGKYEILRSNFWDHGGKEYSVHKSFSIPSLQSRSDVVGLCVSESELTSRVLYLTGTASGEIKQYIDSADGYVDAKGRKFKEYSAVKPNEKINGDQVLRHWYMLPRFTQRHLPNLCMTRISYKESECLFVDQKPDRPIAIDANMITLWSSSEKIVYAAMALLNSSWAKLYLELTCTVMGGGALKIEASHLKKIMFPELSAERYDLLEILGKELIDHGSMTQSIQNRIDDIVLSPVDSPELVEKVREKLVLKLNERSNRT